MSDPAVALPEWARVISTSVVAPCDERRYRRRTGSDWCSVDTAVCRDCNGSWHPGKHHTWIVVAVAFRQAAFWMQEVSVTLLRWLECSAAVLPSWLTGAAYSKDP